MTQPTPSTQPVAPARRRSFESRGLHFIEHHQPLIWGLIAAAYALAVAYRH